MKTFTAILVGYKDPFLISSPIRATFSIESLAILLFLTTLLPLELYWYVKFSPDSLAISASKVPILTFSFLLMQDLQPIDRFIAEEYLLDVLFFFNGCRKECASYMVGLPVPFRYEYLMAETIFSQLLLLPQPPFKPMYYTLVIIDLCKALPGAFPAVVAGAVRALFEKIADLDMECRTRLILWFSHHL
ncbi:Nuclear cap-binding protein subunit 1 [Vitis vinifera]|uniref:Nuclear cap-binding protein subunit 1 n=1 Tax=Vitis vinifera TaxID=29760 RepID=A0A438F2U1_VITVI|nr:Nuclear cap-binding protein subunit 1 [Vitis vinifera]